MNAYVYSLSLSLEGNEEELRKKLLYKHKTYMKNPHGVGSFQDCIKLLESTFLQAKEDSKLVDLFSIQGLFYITDLNNPDNPFVFIEIPYVKFSDKSLEEIEKELIAEIKEKITTII